MRISAYMTTVLMLLTSTVGFTAENNEFIDDGVEVTASTSLYADAQLSRKHNLPIMLIFRADSCAYCVLLEEEIVKPMIRSKEYVDKVIIRTVSIDSSDPIRDFNNESVDVDDFADDNGIFVTPTIKFFDDKGKELAPRMIGINTIDFYGWYLDQAIDNSLAMLRSRKNGKVASLSKPGSKPGIKPEL